MASLNMMDVMAAFEKVSLSYDLDFGYDIEIGATRTFATERDLMEIPIVKQKIGRMLPFNQNFRFSIPPFPGLYGQVAFNVDIQAPIAVQASAGASITIPFRYAEVLEVGLSPKGGTITTSGARPTIKFPELKQGMDIAGFSGIR